MLHFKKLVCMMVTVSVLLCVMVIGTSAAFELKVIDTGKSVEKGYEDVAESNNELWAYYQDGTKELLVKSGTSFNYPSGKSKVYGISNPQVSIDGKKVFFEVGLFATSNAVLSVNVDTKAISYISDGNCITMIKQGEYAGCLIVYKHEYLPGGGSYEPCYIMDQHGNKVKKITDDEVDQYTAYSTSTIMATPTPSSVLVNGKAVAFQAYNISGNNYFKLRDIAKVLTGTGTQFDVGWDSTASVIKITTGTAYTPVGAEPSVSGSPSSTSATPSTSEVYLNGSKVALTAYNIGGNNYFKLRDLADAIGFTVTWVQETGTIEIGTK